MAGRERQYYYTFEEAQAYNPPSHDLFVELLDNCSSKPTTQNGMNGMKFTGSNGGSIFLPAAGMWFGGATEDGVGTTGYYWSSSVDMNYSYRAYCLYITNSSPFKVITYKDIAAGLSVRPVTK